MKFDLLTMVENGGCSAKISPRQLEEILKYLPLPEDPDILVNIDTCDDAGVYKVNDQLALVITTDFFPPICNDPYEFGQIAAANSISDIYAMGGDPIIAVNIMMFPTAKFPIQVLSEILRGGTDKAAEAGVKIIGGHTIDDSPPKYGLAVVGFIDPGRIITNTGAKTGDSLVLTKSIGTGVILAGQKLGLAAEMDIEEAKKQMMLLNKSGSEVMRKFNIKAATDITGFGLGGHALKMARASKVSISIDMKRVPLLGDTYRLIDEGCIPGAAFRNLDYAENHTSFAPGLDYNLKMIAFDAQTSGGLLISVPPESEEPIIKELKDAGLTSAACIGRVLDFGEKLLILN